MDHVYGNVDHGHGKRNCSGLTGQLIRERNSLSPRSLKVLLAALSLLLLCALVALCALGVLVSISVSPSNEALQCFTPLIGIRMASDLHDLNRAVSFEALGEQYASAIFRLSVQEHNVSETERKFELLKVKYQRVHEIFSNCSECRICALCGEGWMSNGEKCCYFSTDKLNWTKSRDHCTEKGGRLVIITSRAEQSFVSSRIGETHWIGLNDLETEGEWTWVNNQTLNETGVEFWQKNEPDNWRHEDPSGKLRYSGKHRW